MPPPPIINSDKLPQHDTKFNLQNPLTSSNDNDVSLNPLSRNTPDSRLSPKSSHFALNPAFQHLSSNENLNALRFEIGGSVRSEGVENLYNAQIIYSQPNRIFRSHGRINLEFGGFFGFDTNVAQNQKGKEALRLSSLNLLFLGISEDILLPLFVSQKYGNFYAGLGIGAYIKSKSESRVGSNFTFGERILVGYLWCKFSIEIFVKHYSNGTLSKPNTGHNFFGITSGVVF